MELMTPMLLLGLGWIGFMLGLQASGKVLRALPRVIYAGAVLDAAVSVLVVCGVSLFGVRLWLGRGRVGHRRARDRCGAGLLLVWVGVWETRSIHISDTAGSQRLALYVRTMGSLGGMLGVMLLGLWSVVRLEVAEGILRIDWESSGLTLAASVMLPVLLGVLARFTLSLAGSSRPEQLVAFLGMVVFAAGIAAQLTVSPILAAMFTGVFVANLPGWEAGIFQRFYCAGGACGGGDVRAACGCADGSGVCRWERFG